MEEFGLAEAALEGEDWKISFRRHAEPVAIASPAAGRQPTEDVAVAPAEAPKGTPISSPMTGIFYASPSPSAPPFVSIGDTVAAGDVVGLIEAMKVFNEITSPVSGTVLEVKAESGQLVNPGEPLIYVG